MPNQLYDSYPYSVLVNRAHGTSFWRCGCGAGGSDADDKLCREKGLVHQNIHTERHKARMAILNAEKHLAEVLRETLTDGRPEGLDITRFEVKGDVVIVAYRLEPGWTWDTVLDLTTTVRETS